MFGATKTGAPARPTPDDDPSSPKGPGMNSPYLRIHPLPVLALAFALAGPAELRAQVPDSALWVANGEVRAMVESGNTLYLGGDFTEVGPSTGAGVPIDAATGAVPSGFPKVAGYVNTVVPDGSGGWFIGGEFNSVGGVPRSNLAHVLADHSVSAWNPGADRRVNDLLLMGGRLYIAGFFNTVAGQTRNGVAAVHATTGQLAPWNPNANTEVNGLATRGSTIYACGRFVTIGGQARNRIAELDTTAGLATAWNPNASGDLTTIAASGSVIYVAGTIGQIGGQTRPYVGAVDAVTRLATAWNPRPNGAVYAIAPSGGVVYLGGLFTSIIANSQTRNRLAATDSATGQATAWNPSVTGSNTIIPQVRELVVDGTTIYVGGLFGAVGGQPRANLAALSATTGLATSWDPHAGSTVLALSASGGTVFAGGYFGSMNGLTRSRLAALDLASGQATAWNPGANYTVHDLAIQGGMVYAVGEFSGAGGQSRQRVAALDAVTGAVTGWNPGTDPTARIYAVAPTPSAIFLGGEFTQMAGLPRASLAAVSPATGQALGWDPNPSSMAGLSVRDLVVSGSRLYVGGSFNYIGGLPRTNLAALDTLTGQAVFGWNPDPDGTVSALAIGDGVVYAGGGFASIGGQARASLAALNSGNALATSWNPGTNGYVARLAEADGVVCAVGQFTSAGGQARKYFAALDVATAQPLVEVADPTFNNFSSGLGAVAIDGLTVYVGGSFTLLNGEARSGVAAFDLASLVDVEPVAGPRPGALDAWPNPFARSVSVAFTLAAEMPVRLEVLDVAGREVWRSPEERFGPGRRSLTWEGRRSDGRPLAAGVYFLRVRGPGIAATRGVVRLD